MIFKKKANLLLSLIVLLSIFFYSHYISKNKGSIEIDKGKKDNKSEYSDFKKGITKFMDVEYKTSDNKSRDYITRGKEAIIDKKNVNVIQLKFVHSFTTLKDGTVLNIRSNKAKYFKNTKNIEYHQNVIITNKNKTITAEKANFDSEKNKISLEKNILYKDQLNIITGDKAEFNTLTNDLEIMMNQKKDKVYGKRY